jgi:hypothetical protein
MTDLAVRPQVKPLLGHTVPRIWTRPLRELTPETSYGFDVIDFARDVLGTPLDPWEEWAVVHLGELLPDGRPRFRQVLILVARQNGKTLLCKVLTLFWMFVECWPLTLSTSTNLDYARESWESVVDMAEASEALAPLIATVRKVNGQQALITTDGARYRIAAANRKGGRSLSIDRLVLDELREHRKWDAWNASTNAQNARPYAQMVAITNAGDDGSIVLNSLHAAAMAGEDDRVGILEWSAPPGCDVMDPDGWCAANPNVGRRLDVSTIRSAALRAKASRGEEEASFRTEVLCQRVRALDAAVDPAAWSNAAAVGTLDAARDRIALCVDISPDGLHATLCAAGTVRPGVVRVEPVAAWSGIGAPDQLRRDLPTWVKRIRPRALGWFPNGPAAALAAELGKDRLPGWPPRNVTVAELGASTAAVCMGFAEQVIAGAVDHPDDPLQDTHVLEAEKLRQGDRWVFSRRGQGGHCDAAYAAAGAVHLARTIRRRPSAAVPASMVPTAPPSG